MTDATLTSPMAGVRVLDCATFIAGPTCATFLGEFGAEVIKVELPKIGCPLRQFGTPTDGADSLPWMSESRNKKSLTLDLRKPEGAAILRDLVRQSDLLVENFPDIFDVQYTARLEEELDEIEEGKETWTQALGDFYKKFEKDLRYAAKHMENIKRMEKPTDEKCERCGSPLVIKWGKHGSFYACSSYDKEDPNSCNFTKENPINLPDLDSADVQETTQEEYCENCGRLMVLKRGRFGQFMACTGYPDCKTTRRLDQGKKVPDIPLDEPCPKCGRNLMIRHGRFGEFTACSGYPECKFVKQNFIGVKCPLCKDGDLVEKKARKGNTFYGCGNYPTCKFTSAYRPLAEKCPSCGGEYLVEKLLKSGPVIACPNKECDYERPVPGEAASAG